MIWKHDSRVEFIHFFVWCAELAQLRASLNMGRAEFSKTCRYEKIPSLSFSDITHSLLNLHLIYTACKTRSTTRVSRLYSAPKSVTPSAALSAQLRENTSINKRKNRHSRTSLHFILAPAQVSQLPNNFIQFAHGYLTTHSAWLSWRWVILMWWDEEVGRAQSQQLVHAASHILKEIAGNKKLKWPSTSPPKSARHTAGIQAADV